MAHIIGKHSKLSRMFVILYLKFNVINNIGLLSKFIFVIWLGVKSIKFLLLLDIIETLKFSSKEKIRSFLI